MSEIATGLLLLAKDNPGVPIAATLVYAPEVDPYAARLVFQDERGFEVMTYTFARDLLAAGLRAQVGIGDVRIGPVANDDWLIFTLTPEGGGAGDAFEAFAPREQVVTFTARCFRLVAANDEHEWIDWDREVSRLIGAGSACRTEVRLWEVDGWRTRMGSLAAALDDPGLVVIQVPTSYGPVVTWRTLASTLAAQTAQARAGDGWVRLEVPGDETLLMQADAVTAFLAARGVA
ncbi:SsgA family sporulation/cell division regulator [Streptosporangium canum]|uniref:SsgA family sporulation/cell division regulator n=1 Tax=Streptosporangium canum TaxID=324952 RepID=UPI0036CF08A6